MRIALIATHHTELAANLALALAREHDVLLVLGRRSAQRQIDADGLALLRRSLRLAFVPHHYAPVQPWIALACRRLIRDFAPDIVHVQEHPTRATGLLAMLLRGRVPLVTTVHDPEPHSGRDARAARPFRFYNARLRALSDRLIVHGEAMAAALAATGIDRARIATVALGTLHNGRLGGSSSAASPPPPPDPGRLIFFGRMERYKGLDTLLAANRLWRERGVPIRLLVAGDGPELAVHRDALRAPNIELRAGRVPQDELAALIAGCAAAILPYHDATQSGVIVTAFGAGRPVICTRVGGLAEAVGDAGLLVPPHDPAALAEAGARLVREPGLHARLTAAVHARTAGALGWRAIARDTLAIYDDILCCRSATPSDSHDHRVSR